METRQVRAYNVQVGDELRFFDTKRHRERVFIVTENRQSMPGVVQLRLRLKRSRGGLGYGWNMKRTTLVRVRRSGDV